MYDKKIKEESLHTVYDFYRHVRKISRGVEQLRDKSLADIPLTGSQIYSLYTIYKLEQCTNAQLAQYSGLAKNSITNLTKKLVENGYVHQVPLKNDRRVITMTISDKGKQIINQIMDSFDLDPNLLHLVEIISKLMDEDENTFHHLNKLLNS